jgi:hypothetical protein
LSFGLGGREIGVKSPISLCFETSSDREFLMSNSLMRKAYMELAALGIFPEMYLKRER